MHATHNQPTVPAPAPDAASQPSPADTLRAAADYLELHGWIQKDYYSDPSVNNPAACTIGALAIAAYGFPNTEPYADDFATDDLPPLEGWHQFVTAEAALAQHLGITAGPTILDNTEGIYAWNDHDGRTATNVIAALRDAATTYERHTGAPDAEQAS